jgi:hypothetical protein
MLPQNIAKNVPRIDFNLREFQELIRTKGVFFTHYAACLCPRIQSIEDHIHHSNCPLNCEDGFLYVKKGILAGIFAQDSKQAILENIGQLEDNSASVTINTHYSDDKNKRAIINIYDKLILNNQIDVLKKHNEYIEVNHTGIDRLSFDPISIDYLISYSGKVFEQSNHFTIENGFLKWITKERPSYNLVEKKGEIYSISYFYYPIYFVKKIFHELRISQTLINNTPTTTQFPMQVELYKDFIFDNISDKKGSSTIRSSRMRNNIPH